jgi:hypothetical protein
MYCAGPPSAAGTYGGLGEPLRVAAAGRQAFEGSSAAALDPMLRRYLSDMVAPYGLGLRADLLDQGRGQSYGEMAGALLTSMVPPGQPLDLIVLAFAMHDVIPGRSVAAHLSHLSPGAPTAFAVCDQGTAAPFAALRLISEYTRAGAARRALLMIVEQETLHYELAAPAALPARNAAVALLCGPAGASRLEAVRQHPGVAAAQAGDLLARELTMLAAGRADLTLIAGGGLAGLAGGTAAARDQTRGDNGRPGPVTAPDLLPPGAPAVDQVLVAPPGQPVTGLWWELAGALPEWAVCGRRVLLADYEPELRYLSVSAIDVEASPAAAVPRLAAQQLL